MTSNASLLPSEIYDPRREQGELPLPSADKRVHLLHAEAHSSIDWLRASSRAPRLVYLDPPFASARDYHLRAVGPGGTSETRVAYRDTWSSLEEYLEFMRSVLEGVHGVLDDDGSVLVHCDHHASPYLAIILDEIFGRGARTDDGSAPGFRNELIWSYGLGGSSPRFWPRKHDSIYWYTKGSDWFFEAPLVPATSQRMKGKLKKMPDVIDIPTINNMAKERTGYPTQKPLRLLETLIKAHSRAGDLVLDLFGGSGTTALAAWRLGRSAITADASHDAVALMRSRLLESGAPICVWRSPNIALPAGEPTSPPVFAARGRMSDGTFESTSWCTDAEMLPSWLDETSRASTLLVRRLDGGESFDDDGSSSG